MRADRLVAILLLLQTRGHITAAEVATELEVSERTARRDLEALGMAGIPIYSQQGRNGGGRLAGGGRPPPHGPTAPGARGLVPLPGPPPTAATPVKTGRRPIRGAPPAPARPG